MPIKNYLLATVIASLFTHNATAMTVSPLSDEELVAGVCVVATSGVHTAISERQAGSDKATTEKVLTQELQKLSHSFSHPSFLQGLKDSWYRALDSAYRLPVQDTDTKKQAMISAVTEEAFISCMNNLHVR